MLGVLPAVVCVRVCSEGPSAGSTSRAGSAVAGWIGLSWSLFDTPVSDIRVLFRDWLKTEGRPGECVASPL